LVEQAVDSLERRLALENLKNHIENVTREEVIVVPYDPAWPRMFQQEKEHLLSCLPHNIIKRIEHFGSTAIPQLSAKPIIDILVEVSSLEETKVTVVPILLVQGYDYFRRPTWGDDIPPFYAWFIKRNPQGKRTHHIHMVEQEFEHWDRILFRDYLIEHPDLAQKYQAIKVRSAELFSRDRIAYTKMKDEFIVHTTQLAKEYYKKFGEKYVGGLYE